MLRLATLLCALQLASGEGSIQRSLISADKRGCDQNPSILSYHIHFRWDATNLSASAIAKQRSDAFAQYMNAPAGVCPFSHANAAGWYKRVCSFPFDWESILEHPTNGTSGIFGGINHAYFIPLDLAVKAMNWWRQNHDELSFMMHVNTGCEYKDHSEWSMKSNNYPQYTQSLEGLWCCKQGPPGCTCDMVVYRELSTKRCLSIPPALQVPILHTCNDTMLSWGSTGVWRETKYTRAFNQLEAYDNGSLNGGGSYAGGGRCVAPDSCKLGARLRMVPCEGGNHSLVSWKASMGVDGHNLSRALRGGRLVSDSCPGMCIVPLGDSAVLGACSGIDGDGWERQFLD